MGEMLVAEKNFKICVPLNNFNSKTKATRMSLKMCLLVVIKNYLKHKSLQLLLLTIRKNYEGCWT